MKYLFKDSSSGKMDGAKTLNTITWAICLTKITLSGATVFGHTFGIVTPDIIDAYTQMMMVTGAIYGGRAYTKSRQS